MWSVVRTEFKFVEIIFVRILLFIKSHFVDTKLAVLKQLGWFNDALVDVVVVVKIWEFEKSPNLQDASTYVSA